MNNNLFDIKFLYSYKKNNLQNMKYIHILSRPSKEQIRTLNVLCNKKKKEIINFIISENGFKFDYNFWDNLILSWSIKNFDYIKTYYHFLEQSLPKKKVFKIYKINYKNFSEVEHECHSNPEKFTLWLTSEYIKFKKFEYQEFSYQDSKKQKKFNIFYKKTQKKKNYKFRLYSLINFFINKIFKPKLIIDDIGLSIAKIISLNLKFMQFPSLWLNLGYNKNIYDNFLRKKFLSFLKYENDFEFFLNQIIIKIFPKAYLEDFANIISVYLDHYNIPKVYFTQNVWNPIEKRIFINLLKAKGSKIFISQHGGNYGTGIYSHGEHIERVLADNLLTWGWKKNVKDIKFISLKFSNYKKEIKNTEESKKILFCSNLSTFFLNKPYMLPRSSIDSLETVDLINNLSKFLKTKDYQIVLRYLLNSQNSGNFIDKKLYDKKIIFDNFNLSLKNELYKYKLVIHENLSTTTYLETLALDFPSIIFMSQKNKIFLRDSFNIYLDDLVKAKIVHTNLRSLEEFLNLNLSSIEAWWYSETVRNILKIFKKNYIRTDKNVIPFLVKFLKKYN
jgi:putative transferase (TIGR04331 family)